MSLFSLQNNHSINCHKAIVSRTLKNTAVDSHSNLYIFFYIISSLRSILCNNNFRFLKKGNSPSIIYQVSQSQRKLLVPQESQIALCHNRKSMYEERQLMLLTVLLNHFAQENMEERKAITKLLQHLTSHFVLLCCFPIDGHTDH